MKKIMLFSFFAAFLMTAFAFTPANDAIADGQNTLFSTCVGSIQASIQCATEDPTPATVTIRNKETGALVYTGPADGTPAELVLAEGVYVVSVATSGHCQFTVKWDFCGSGAEVIVVVNNGSAIVGSIEVC